MCEEPDKFKSILFGRNEDWEDEWWVDVTKDIWIKKIKDQVLKAKKRGFQGIWLDNGDIYWYVLEKMKDRSKASKIFVAMMEMCKWIKSQGMFLILNGADTFVSLLIDTKKQSCIDGVNQETVFTKITSYKENGEFTKQDPDEQKYYTDDCKKCKNAGLTVLLLEYGSEPVGLKSFKYADAYYVSKGLLL